MAADSISNRRGKKGKQHEQREREVGEQAGRTLGEAAEQVTDYVSAGVGQMGERFRETTHGREGTVLLISLAAGFGLGVVLGTALAAPHRRQRHWYDRSAAESIGRRVMERVEHMLPQGLADCFGR